MKRRRNRKSLSLLVAIAAAALILSLIPNSAWAAPPVRDRDSDGYASDEDCNDNDASINPGASEVCDDGVDNNCDGNIDEGCASMAGDLDGDNDIDGDDYNIFIAAFGRCEGDPLYNSGCDFDGDKCTTFVDYQIWYGYYMNQ